MNLYKAAISALVLAPVVGGISIHMLHNYQEMKQKAENLAGYSQEQLRWRPCWREKTCSTQMLYPVKR